MDKFRKILAAVSAALCVYFAVQAYMQKRESREVESLELKGWGSGMLTLARKYDRLVLFNVEGVGDGILASPSPQSARILSRHYVRVTLRREYFPADYGAILRIYRLSGAKGQVGFGILSPKGYPIFMGRDLPDDPASELGEEKVLAGVAWMYKKRKAETKNGLQIALARVVADRELSDLPGFFSGGRRTAEIANIRSLFAVPAWGESVAVFSENARLIARLAAGGDQLSRQTALLVRDELLKRLEDGSIGFTDRLLLVRALSEYAMLSDSARDREAFKNASLEVLSTLGKDGYFAPSGTALLRDNALALSIMARACRLFGDGPFKSALASSSAALMRNMEKRSMLPAVLRTSADPDPRSEASALDYALLARAFLDSYFATGGGDVLGAAKKAFSKLDEIFKDPSSEAWFENGKNSVFANFLRYKIISDSGMPSTTGEAVQILADINSLSGGISGRFIKILSALNMHSSPEAFLDRASSKLAMLANPMRTGMGAHISLSGE